MMTVITAPYSYHRQATHLGLRKKAPRLSFAEKFYLASSIIAVCLVFAVGVSL